MSIESDLKTLVVERLFLNIDPAAIVDEAPLTDCGVDSFLLLELVVAMEEQFGVRFEPGDINATNLRSISSLAAMIRAKQPAAV